MDCKLPMGGKELIRAKLMELVKKGQLLCERQQLG